MLQRPSPGKDLLLPAGPVLSPACCASRLLLPDAAWCRLQTILKRPGAYEGLRGTDDEDEGTDQEGAHLLAPEVVSPQEGTERGSSPQPEQQNGAGNGWEGTSQHQLGSGSQHSQRAGPSCGPSSGPEPPAAQGPGAPQETLRHMPEALSQVVAPDPADAESRTGQMEVAFQVGSLFSSFKFGGATGKSTAVSAPVADGVKLPHVQGAAVPVQKLRRCLTGACISHG